MVVQQHETVAFLASAFAAGLIILHGRRQRESIWHPMSSWWIKRRALVENTRLDNLLVIADFDATITTGDSIQCHDMLGFSELMTPAFRREFAPLLDWATNPDVDGVAWWDKAHELMIKHGQPPRHLIPRMVRETRMEPRPGALKLLARLAVLQVPLLIVSAGLSDVIEEFLRQHDALTENITVCSNRLNYGADSAPQSVAPSPPITSFTKDTAYRASSAFFRQHSRRSTLIVIGDSCSDIDAATNVPHEHGISIGFLNGKEIGTEASSKHLQTYDALVLAHDGSLAPVDELVDEIARTDTNVPEKLVRRMSFEVKQQPPARPLRAHSQRGD